MSRLIDANELQSEYKKYHDGKRSVLIDVAPTIDAVEVVRCKDCKHYDKEDHSVIFADRCYCATMDVYMKSDCYCSYAERRSDGID